MNSGGLMQYTYPFPSHKNKLIKTAIAGVDYDLWTLPGMDMASLWSGVDGPIIEIGGPSDLGYYFLENITLPSKPIITNISNNPVPFAEHADQYAAMVDEIVDGTKMPYDNESVGALLMANISHTKDDWVELDEVEKERLMPEIEGEHITALYETARVVAGIIKPEEVHVAQNVTIILESMRVLKPGGLLVIDGATTETLSLLRLIGFEIIGLIQDFESFANKTFGEVLARKP